jgi:hypothetical protein
MIFYYIILPVKGLFEFIIFYWFGVNLLGNPVLLPLRFLVFLAILSNTIV